MLELPLLVAVGGADYCLMGCACTYVMPVALADNPRDATAR
jgi:hypothetical protein